MYIRTKRSIPVKTSTKTIKMTNLEYADKWFELHQIISFIHNESLYLDVGQGLEVELSEAEVEYRAKLYLSLRTQTNLS